LRHALGGAEGGFDGPREGDGSLPIGVLLALLFGAGFTAGTAGLALVERRVRAAKPPPLAGGATEAMTVEQAEVLSDELSVKSQALRTGMAIAAAIGLHNFAEGLAIGVSASTGEIGLATVLIVGFPAPTAPGGF